MIPYEDLVAALDELNGKAPAVQRPAQKRRETGAVRAAAPQVLAYPEQNTMTANLSDLVEEPAAAPAPDPLRDISLMTAEPEEMDMLPLATAEPEPAGGDSFEVLTEEPLPPAPPESEAGNDDFDILSESELPPPPESVPARAPAGHFDEVLGDNAFSNFFESNEAPAGESENGFYEAPTPPPEEDSGEFLPPPPPPPDDWK